MTCGIYMIQNIVNGKMYIGQSVNIEDRWGDHKNGLRGNCHINKHLQNAWNKDGESNFEFTVICECDESQLNTMEIYYIAKLKTHDPDFGYNKTYGGEGGRPTAETKKKISKNNSRYWKGKTLSEEHKKRLSASMKGENAPFYGKHLSEEHKIKLSEAHSKPIVQIDPSTNIIVNVWGSSHEAEREGGFHKGNIISCCKGNRNTHKGYKWMYLRDWLKEHNKGIPKKLYFID